MKKVILISILILALIAGYFAVKYNYVKSDGVRSGILQKFSRKGLLFKTYEGEVVQNSMKTFSTKVFYFSVTDQAIADSLEKCVGKEITIRYNEYYGSLPWRGDDYSEKAKSQNNEDSYGQYIVSKIEQVVSDQDQGNTMRQLAPNPQMQQQQMQQQQVQQQQVQQTQPAQQSTQQPAPVAQ